MSRPQPMTSFDSEFVFQARKAEVSRDHYRTTAVLLGSKYHWVVWFSRFELSVHSVDSVSKVLWREGMKLLWNLDVLHLMLPSLLPEGSRENSPRWGWQGSAGLLLSASNRPKYLLVMVWMPCHMRPGRGRIPGFSDHRHVVLMALWPQTWTLHFVPLSMHVPRWSSRVSDLPVCWRSWCICGRMQSQIQHTRPHLWVDSQ